MTLDESLMRWKLMREVDMLSFLLDVADILPAWYVVLLARSFTLAGDITGKMTTKLWGLSTGLHATSRALLGIPTDAIGYIPSQADIDELERLADEQASAQLSDEPSIDGREWGHD